MTVTALFAGDASLDLTLRIARIPEPDEKLPRAGTNLPVIVGSGLDAAQVPTLLAVADGAIVGQWFKRDGLWWNPVDPWRVETLMRAIMSMRDGTPQR